MLETLYMLLMIIPIKQLTGYSYWNTIWRIIVAIIPFFGMIMALAMVGYVLLFVYALIKFA